MYYIILSNTEIIRRFDLETFSTTDDSYCQSIFSGFIQLILIQNINKMIIEKVGEGIALIIVNKKKY